MNSVYCPSCNLSPCGCNKTSRLKAVDFKRDVHNKALEMLSAIRPDLTKRYKYDVSSIKDFGDKVSNLQRRIAKLEPISSVVLVHNFCKTNKYPPPIFQYTYHENLVECSLTIQNYKGDLIGSQTNILYFIDSKETKKKVQRMTCDNFIKVK